MKRKIIASLLGFGGSIALVASSHGQGTVFFLNYATDVNAPVTFGSAGTVGANSVTAGEAVGSEFTAALLYSLNGGSTFTLLDQASAGAGGSYPTPFLSTDGNSANGAGYFNGPIVTIPGYTSGPISFMVQAYHGSSYANADWKGQSASFTLPSIATGTTQTGDLVGMPGFVVNVPEPSIFALAGLGAAGLMAFRRKK